VVGSCGEFWQFLKNCPHYLLEQNISFSKIFFWKMAKKKTRKKFFSPLTLPFLFLKN
jgi:hypothetical protein